MENPESQAKQLLEKLGREARLGWDAVSVTEKEKVFAFSEDYKAFLDRAKTERETVAEILGRASSMGFQPLDQLGEAKTGSKFFLSFHGKAVALGIIGSKALADGLCLVGAHVDSPRLDLKPSPLYEAQALALLKTHYYGGIKKYHWLVMPLALHGIVVKSDGQALDLVIGEDDSDPVFTITDLLPHLGKDQGNKKLAEAFSGEDLNLLVGSIPYPVKEAKNRVKLAILDYLHSRHGLVEEDFVSAELEVVPAWKARDVGLDRGLVGAYGQDDRVCAFGALRAILDQEGPPSRTALALFMDKEEIGSMGNTGMQSRLLPVLISRLQAVSGLSGTDNLLETLIKSEALSADVTGAIDPTYEGVMDKYNAPAMGKGVVLTKYTGSRGKYAANDAHAELVGRIRRLFNSEGIVWQTGELGKVDEGGGGTIAQYVANLGVNIVDCGVPLLSMHSPLELASKVDIYMQYRAYRAFLGQGS